MYRCSVSVGCHLPHLSCKLHLCNAQYFHLHAFYNVACQRKKLFSTVTDCRCGCVKTLRTVTQTKLNMCVFLCVCVYDMFCSSDIMLKRIAASQCDTSAPQRTVKAALYSLSVYDLHKRLVKDYMVFYGKTILLNTLRTGLLNCLNARSRGLTFRHRASSI